MTLIPFFVNKFILFLIFIVSIIILAHTSGFTLTILKIIIINNIITDNFIIIDTFIEVWCNGSTMDFGSISSSSNLGTSTNIANDVFIDGFEIINVVMGQTSFTK